MYTVGILTVSTKGAAGQREDKSGDVIRERVTAAGNKVVDYTIVTDDKEIIARKMKEWADRGGMDVLMSTGGTGLSQSDVTPEATLSIIEKLVPGLPEIVRIETSKKTPTAVLSRGVAGVRKKCLIVNMPGSPKAVSEWLDIILPVLQHAVDILTGAVTEHVERHQH